MKKHLRGTVAGCLFVILIIGFLAFRSSTSQAYSPKKKPQANGPFVPGRVLVQFRPELLSLRGPDVIAEEGASDSGEIGETGVHIVELPAGADEHAYLQAFQSRPEVEFAELDRIVPPADVTPNDPWFPDEWHLTKIAAPTAWNTTIGSSGVTIAILDTGVEGTHPELSAKMVPGWNVYDNNANTSDEAGHGTIVAGAAAALSNNGAGVASVAWNCLIMPVRISDPSGNASYSNAASGLIWAADHGARVANISYMMTTSSTVTSAATYFQSRGGVVTISAGNYSTFDPSPDNAFVLTISASNSSDVLYPWSNTGNNIDLAAPGFVYTTIRGGGTSTASGTSVAAPVVAGVAALVLSANPGLSASQLQDILKQSADDRGPVGRDPSFGWGRVNAARAVNIASGGDGADATPPTVTFNSPTAGATVANTVSVQVAASDNVSVASVSLSVDGSSLGSDNSSPYTFSWNTSTVSNRVHTLTAIAQDASGNSASSSITVTVNNVADTTAPTISITSPTNGAAVSGNLSVFVNTLDNVAVVKVELYADAQLKATSTSAPLTTKWNTRREAAGGHSLQCKAYDAAGNVGASTVVTVYR